MSEQETREEVLERLVREMLDEGTDLTKSSGYPELPVLKERFSAEWAELFEDDDDPPDWDVPSAKERDEVAARVLAEQTGPDKPAVQHGQDAGGDVPTPPPPSKPFMATTLYAMGRPSQVAGTRVEEARLRQRGYKAFDEYTVDERRALHPMQADR